MPSLSPNKQCQSTDGKNITFHGLAHPKLTWVFQLPLHSTYLESGPGVTPCPPKRDFGATPLSSEWFTHLATISSENCLCGLISRKYCWPFFCSCYWRLSVNSFLLYVPVCLSTSLWESNGECSVKQDRYRNLGNRFTLNSVLTRIINSVFKYDHDTSNDTLTQLRRQRHTCHVPAP